MSLPVTITNGGRGLEAQVHESTDGESGLLVFVRERDEIELITRPLLNDTYGANMNQNGAVVPSVTENIHDGIDNVYWTASALSGTWVFDSTAQNHTPAGNKSIDGTATSNNNQAAIDRGSLLALTPYDVLTGWIYITGWSTGGTRKDVDLEFQDASSTLVGNNIALSGYIDTTLFNAWQQFVIPLSDFGLTSQSIQILELTTIDIGGGAPPNYYLDDLSLTDTGDGIEFKYSPDAGETVYINKVKFLMRDALNVTTSNQHGFDLSGILGISTLTNGILAGKSVDGSIATSAIVKDLQDWFKFPQMTNITSGGNGTNTWVSFELDFTDVKGLPISAKSNDKFFVKVRDNLSGLLYFQAWLEGYIVTNR